MTSGFLRHSENIITGRLFPALEKWLWDDDSDTDSQTVPVYLFKPFPPSLKRAQTDDWVELQQKAMSPFVDGDSYNFKTAGGVALWLTPSHFSGIPESALQQALPDGTHTVAGKHLWYRQTWQNRTMLACEAFPIATVPQDATALSPTTTPWANQGKLESVVRSSSFWAGILGFIFLCTLVWFIAGYISLTIQANEYAEQAADIEVSLGDKLDQQANFQKSQQLITGMNTWRNVYGYLPQTLSVVIDKVLQKGAWEAELIEWQNKTLRVEINAPNLDITSLVADLEAAEELASVGIRPAAKNGVWILEVTIK